MENILDKKNKIDIEKIKRQKQKHSARVSRGYRKKRDQMNKILINFIADLFCDNPDIINNIKKLNIKVSNGKMKSQLFDIIYNNRDHLNDRIKTIIKLTETINQIVNKK